MTTADWLDRMFACSGVPRKQTGECVFLHGLWGDWPDCRYRTITLPKTLDDIRKNIDREPYKPNPKRVFCFGAQCRDYLTSLDQFEPVMLLEDSIVKWAGDGERWETDQSGRINWGVSFWRHKLMVIRFALEIYSAVVWLDWDCWNMQPIPEDFWPRMALGRPVQLALRGYVRPQCPWRPKTADGFDRQIPHGGFIYCRDVSIIDEAIARHEQFPTVADEGAFAKLFDDWWGGWGQAQSETYRDGGYTPWCYWTKGAVYPVPENDRLFWNVGR